LPSRAMKCASSSALTIFHAMAALVWLPWQPVPWYSGIGLEIAATHSSLAPTPTRCLRDGSARLPSPRTKPILRLVASLTARRQLLLYVALPLAYIVTGRLGLLLAADPGYATVVFLPAGIAVTATFFAGVTALPGIFLGSFLLNLWIGYLIVGQLNLTEIAAALVIAAGSMTQAAIGGTVLRRTIGYPAAFQKPSDIFLFFLVAPILCLTSATLSLGGLWALGVIELPDLPMNWVMWWLGDTLGVLVALPLMIWLADEP
jgi:integral membrane sensor domain MASE1